MRTLDSLERSIEAILFASGEPVELEKISVILSIDQETVKNLIVRIRDRYFEQRSPLDIVALGAAYQMCTLPQYADDVRAVLEFRKQAPLSSAALEVLAVIAYNQPVTRGFVEQVRGVECGSIVRGLVDKGLVEEAGRLNIPGKPISYCTTANFLRTFGLQNLEQLPPVCDLSPDDACEETEDVPLEGQTDLFEVE